MFRFEFEAIGTRWQIDLYEELTAQGQKEILEKIQKRISAFDKTYSRFRDDSLVIEMARKSGRYILPADSKKLFEVYSHFYELTEGAMTPLIGQVLSDAGYDAMYTLITKELHKPKTWKESIDFSYPYLTMKEPALLDFGAAGKGYLIDIVGGLLKQHGYEDFCVEAGGDMLYFRSKKNRNEKNFLKVGLENPDDIEQVIGVATIDNQAICGSAGNRRKWGEFTHLINPYTLKSPKHILANWVIAESTILADALATALYFTPPDQLQMHYNFEYLLLYQGFSVDKSAHFPAELFYK